MPVVQRFRGSGLKIAFLILLVTVVVRGILTLRARRTYPVDVATAVASENEMQTVS